MNGSVELFESSNGTCTVLTVWKTPSVTFNLYASINSSGAHPPQATAEHLLTLSVPGLGHSQIYRSLGAGHQRTPARPPGHLAHVFSKDGRVYREG